MHSACSDATVSRIVAKHRKNSGPNKLTVPLFERSSACLKMAYSILMAGVLEERVEAGW